MTKGEPDDDIVLEPEDADGTATPAQREKKLREALKRAKAEAAENLAGWQRSKADYVNLARRTRDEGATSAKNGVMALAGNIIAVFDSLEAARKCAEPEGGAVLAGIEQVIKQLETALKESGIERFTPKAGEPFDPAHHEPVRTVATDNEKEDNTISETLQSGYAFGEAAVRPARVSVKHYQQKDGNSE